MVFSASCCVAKLFIFHQFGYVVLYGSIYGCREWKLNPLYTDPLGCSYYSIFALQTWNLCTWISWGRSLKWNEMNFSFLNSLHLHSALLSFSSRLINCSFCRKRGSLGPRHASRALLNLKLLSESKVFFKMSFFFFE